ncbi:hypothetical protein OSB04_010321 [Centaurea solstitialis]|uniref:Lipoxygenase domain-containing protein n=1 Tax=Centaurea solstitialis TaxID=347529 RepID=A0AA38WCQ6_9ASTR|nr:hypothetical protein OSB04_010321 [Centaurea solstitialis]
MVRAELTTLKKDDSQHNRARLKKSFDGLVTEEQTFILELVSVDLNSLDKSTSVKVQKTAEYIKSNYERTMFIYECNFEVPESFGEIEAALVKNEHNKEIYIKNIVLDDGNVTFTCESWIDKMHGERIFFTNKQSYLPSETPAWLKYLRGKDLESLRGNDETERKPFERIYGYDLYNDLGDGRPVLGGQEHPYPRRCRTGRTKTPGETSKGTH